MNWKIKSIFLVSFFCLGCSMLIGCNAKPNESIQVESSNEQPMAEPVPDQGYPHPGAITGTSEDTGYPGSGLNIIEDLSQDIPEPEVNLPSAEETTGVVGGVLISAVLDQGYKPLTPVSLSLAEVINTMDGQPAYIRSNSESLKAELFPTGVFVFSRVSPGDYGLMVDVGYTQFPIKGDDGWPIIITVEPGQAIDLGQVITELPNS